MTDLVASSEDQEEIQLSKEVFGALDSLRDFMFEQVYLREDTHGEHERATRLIRELFQHFLDHPDDLPEEYHRAPGDLPTRVADYISGMTDRYAIRTYERLFLPPRVAARPGVGGVVARIRQEDIEAVKDRTDIVALVSQYLALKKTGHDSMSGLCPFHQEKSASFSVSPAKGVFYCFGCGKGGDAITFLRELESLSYVEAVERLAQLAGVTLRYEGDSAAERKAAARRNALFAANEKAAQLYVQMLRDGREAEDARAYVTERGLSAESLEGFGIGYAPGYPDFLLRRLSEDFGPGDPPGGRPRLAGRGRRGPRPVPGQADVPDPGPPGPLPGVRRPDPAERRAGGGDGQVSEHRRDADLPEGRDPLQPPPGAADRSRAPGRCSWSRATRT